MSLTDPLRVMFTTLLSMLNDRAFTTELLLQKFEELHH